MKIRKFALSILLSVICVLFLMNFSALADEDVIVNLQINNPIMQINGVDEEIDAGRGTSPIISNGRTIVPIRAIIEAFDGKVDWDNNTKSAILTIEDDVAVLTIDSNVAYFNNEPYILDTTPVIINGRTMLPIRFIAESFNLGVAWNNDTRTVTLIRNGLDEKEYSYIVSQVPEFTGNPVIMINDNIPMFKSYEIIPASFEFYANLDELGRCDVTMASISSDLMPDGDRESISDVTPTGWMNKRYDSVPGGYLYNRCHLIGYQLTGENANERNLITGTRYLNIEGMLPYENMVDEYIDATGNRVMYRVTPVFKDNNLLADGVLMEAYSLEDNGAGISFCVYCYNVQPSIFIDYLTGNSCEQGSDLQMPQVDETGGNVYRTPSGKRYHLDAECGGKNSYKITMEEAVASDLSPCKTCAR